MAASYSMDLRKRVIEAVEGGRSCNQPAARFDVAISTAIGWVNRYRETGSFAPDRMGGHRPKKLVGEYREWLLKRCREKHSPCAAWSASWPSDVGRQRAGSPGRSAAAPPMDGLSGSH